MNESSPLSQKISTFVGAGLLSEHAGEGLGEFEVFAHQIIIFQLLLFLLFNKLSNWANVQQNDDGVETGTI